jgi:hypothetical protein
LSSWTTGQESRKITFLRPRTDRNKSARYIVSLSSTIHPSLLGFLDVIELHVQNDEMELAGCINVLTCVCSTCPSTLSFILSIFSLGHF